MIKVGERVTPENIEQLPAGTTIRHQDGWRATKIDEYWWRSAAGRKWSSDKILRLEGPAYIYFIPVREAPQLDDGRKA